MDSGVNTLNEASFALLIFSCDKFSDLWEAHVTLLNKYWPNRKCKTYIVTDKASTQHFDGIEIVACGDDTEMSDRVQYICNYIKEDYVLVTLDDYFPDGEFNEDKFENLVTFIKENNGDYLRFFKRPKKEGRKKINKDIYRISDVRKYSINLYPGLWKKEFFYKTVDCSLNAWKFEVSLTNRALELNVEAYVIPKSRKFFPFMDVVRKGKILRKAWKKIRKMDIYHGNRPIRTRMEEFKLSIRTFVSRYFPSCLVTLMKKISRKLFKKKYYSEN